MVIEIYEQYKRVFKANIIRMIYVKLVYFTKDIK